MLPRPTGGWPILLAYGKPSLAVAAFRRWAYSIAMGTAHKLEQWDEFVGERYDPNRKAEDFRKYDESAPPGVREFYRENHAKQTREFAQSMKRKYGARAKGEMSIWEACEFLNTLVDESDPD